MKRPTIGVVIATPGRRSLLRTLNSIMMQGLEPGDDVLVVGDGHHEPTKELVDMMGSPFRYVATTKTRDWGHSQVNHGLKSVGGEWLMLQDDDDVFLPRAFDEARAIISKLDTPRPIIGRVMTPFLGILWTEPGKEPLDGHCLVVPNDKKKLGYVGLEYAGDQKWLQTNLDAYETYTWADRIWALTRPKNKLWPMLSMRRGEDFVSYTFHRDEGGVWGEVPTATLEMSRTSKDYWTAFVQHRDTTTVEELREVVEFAAWAGQGSDVWLTAVRAGDRRLIAAANRSGYVLHTNDGLLLEYVFEWPPHKFEPPPKKEPTE